MIDRILTVGGFTLLSRVTGFVRDIMLAAVLGAGPVADAFFVALRLPNHFRAIFAEGAFNAAFVPAYARIREQGGAERAGLFADRIFTLLLASQIVLLGVALVFTPEVIDVLAPGFAHDPGALCARGRTHAHHFPYLLLVTLVTLYGGILNALQRFAAAAAAPILLNLSLIVGAGAGGLFSDRRSRRRLGRAGRGRAEFLLVAGERGAPVCWRRCAGRSSTPMCANSSARWARRRSARPACSSRCLPTPSSPASCPPARCRRCITPTASTSLPIGVIGIAAGTVVLPEMSRRIAAGDEAGARHAQNRAIEFTLLLSIPCLAAFFVIPELIMRALFMRGAFTAADADAAGADAHGLRLWAVAVRSDPQRGRDLLCARRHGDAGEGRADRGRGQYRASRFC